MPEEIKPVAPVTKADGWGAALPPVATEQVSTYDGGDEATNPFEVKAEDEEVPTSDKNPKDFGLPESWVLAVEDFLDGAPRVKMWRDPEGPVPHAADVHPDNVVEWSQLGWNVLQRIVKSL